MKKALIVMAVLAIVAPASAGNLPTGDAIYYYASWGGAEDVNLTDNGDGSLTIDLGDNNGSDGVFWRLPAYVSENVTLEGTWSGDTGGSGWAEIMFFTSTEGQSDQDVIDRIDAGNAADIIAKYDAWELPPKVFGPIDIDDNPYFDNPGIHATCNDVIVAVKAGNTATFTFDLTYVPEPASAMLLLGGLPLLFRRRRA